MLKGEQTRELIIEQSAELFNRYGYHGCSLSDIMKATGLKKGGIYNHFKNKDEIALAAFDSSFKKVLKRFRLRLDKDTTSLQKLHSILAVFESFLHDPVVKGGCPIGNTAVDSSNSHSELSEKAANAINILRDYITIKINEGVEVEEFRKGINSQEMAVLIVTSLEGALILSRVNNDDKYMRTTVTFLKKYISENLISA